MGEAKRKAKQQQAWAAVVDETIAHHEAGHAVTCPLARCTGLGPRGARDGSARSNLRSPPSAPKKLRYSNLEREARHGRARFRGVERNLIARLRSW
jgi:hypothetical protein